MTRFRSSFLRRHHKCKQGCRTNNWSRRMGVVRTGIGAGKVRCVFRPQLEMLFLRSTLAVDATFQKPAGTVLSASPLLVLSSSGRQRNVRVMRRSGLNSWKNLSPCSPILTALKIPLKMSDDWRSTNTDELPAAEH